MVCLFYVHKNRIYAELPLFLFSFFLPFSLSSCLFYSLFLQNFIEDCTEKTELFHFSSNFWQWFDLWVTFVESFHLFEPMEGIKLIFLRGLSKTPAGSDGIEFTCNVGDLGSIPELGRSLGGGHSNPLQLSCLEKPHGQRSLVGYSLWGHKELDTTEWPSTAHTS